MLTLMNKRLNDERGFTLIELLVVMIIIAILMGIAIPKFLGNKDKAQATKAKTAIRLAQETIEACAASQPDGTFGTGANDCRQIATLTTNEPSLAKAISAVGAPTNGMGLTVTAQGVAGYTITAQIQQVSPVTGLQMRVFDGTGVEWRNCGGATGLGGGAGCAKVANGATNEMW